MLVDAGLVTREQVDSAAASQQEHGGRLGDHLAAIGAIRQEDLEKFLHLTPKEPASLADVGIDPTELLNLLLKLVYVERLHRVPEFARAIKLPPHLIMDLVHTAVERHLLQSAGSGDAQFGNLRYALSEEGKRWAVDALQQCRYAGPAPVPIDDFTAQVNRQKLTNETITHARIRAALSDLVVDERLIEQSGPAMATSRAMLLYGPPGNGKTSVAVRLAHAFQDVIYVPHAVSIDGQIIRVFDTSIHESVDPEGCGGGSAESPPDGSTEGSAEEAFEPGESSFVPRRQYDNRWVPCRRPVVITGGELTLEMLDLRYDPISNFYEAPLHMKALGGCLFIDDFGRQLLSATHLLNRWIVPLENRVDFMRLQSGKTFRLPFEELLVFSTNLEPEDLMDPAFLRRLPYKIEISAPSPEHFRRILALECKRHGLWVTEQIFQHIVDKITGEKEMELAAYHPRFIVEQVVATCRFLGEPLHFHPRFVDHAIDNLRVRRNATRSSQTHAHV